MPNQFKITFANGDTEVVQATIADRLHFETTLRKNRGRWGKLEDNALKLDPFLAWSAYTKRGKTGPSWQEFTEGEQAVIDVERIDEDDDDAEEAELEVEGVGKDIPTEASITSV